MRIRLSPGLLILLLSSTVSFGGQGVATVLVTIATQSGVGSMDFNANGTQLALYSIGAEGSDIYDLKRRQIVQHLPFSGTGGARGELVRYSPDGKLLAICGYKRPFVGIYSVTTWEIVHEIGDESKEGPSDCRGIAFTPDGKKLIRLTASAAHRPDSDILVYDISTWQVIQRFRTQAINRNPSRPAPQKLESYVITPDTILIDQSDPTVSFIDTALNSVYAVSPDGRYLALGGTAMGGKQFLTFAFKTSEEFAQFNAAHHFTIAIIDIQNHKLVRVIRAEADSLDWSPDGVYLAAAGGGTGNVEVFDSRSGEEIASEKGQPARGLVRYTPDGKYLIANVGQRVEIWDGRHHRLLQTIRAEPRNIAVSPDGHYLALCGDDVNSLDANPLLGLFAHPNGVGGKTIVYTLK